MHRISGALFFHTYTSALIHMLIPLHKKRIRNYHFKQKGVFIAFFKEKSGLFAIYAKKISIYHLSFDKKMYLCKRHNKKHDKKKNFN